MSLKLHNRRWYPLIFLTAAVATATLWFYFAAGQRPELLLSSIGAAGGLTYFLYRQHLDETKLFRELFVAFNERYDKLNEHLNDILADGSKGAFNSKQREHLFSYFNLCAEEYLFHRAGYIDQHVWNSWSRGMKVFFDHPRIRALWEQDCKADSYYGFRPPKQTLRPNVAPPEAERHKTSAATWQNTSHRSESPSASFSVEDHFTGAPSASIAWTQEFVNAALSYRGVDAFKNDAGIGFRPNFIFVERVYTEEEGFSASFYGSPQEFAKYGLQMERGRSNSYSRFYVHDVEHLKTATKCVHISANLRELERLRQPPISSGLTPHCRQYREDPSPPRPLGPIANDLKK